MRFSSYASGQMDKQTNILITKYNIAKVTMKTQSLLTKCCEIEIDINVNKCVCHCSCKDNRVYTCSYLFAQLYVLT